MDRTTETRHATKQPRYVQGEQGMILALSLLMMTLLSVLGAALLSLSSADVLQGRISQNRLQAFHLAEAGSVFARRALSLDQDLDGNAVSDQTQIFTNNQPINWNSTTQLAALQPGASGSVTIVRHAGDPERAVITSTATFGSATKAIEVVVRRATTYPPGVKGAVTTNGPTATNGNIQIDGRDHAINGTLIANSGTYGIFTANTYAQGGSSDVGGTDTYGIDRVPSKPGDPSVIEDYGNFDDPSTYQVETMPVTPDQVMGGTANGFPDGTLKQIAMSGANGSQYVTDPAALTFPLSGVTYVELPPGAEWVSVNFGDSSGILVVHNSSTNAVIKNLNGGTFKGLLIADDIVHIHTTILGAVVSLTTLPSSGNVIGNGSGDVRFSRAALAAAGNLTQKIWPVIAWRETR